MRSDANTALVFLWLPLLLLCSLNPYETPPGDSAVSSQISNFQFKEFDKNELKLALDSKKTVFYDQPQEAILYQLTAKIYSAVKIGNFLLIKGKQGKLNTHSRDAEFFKDVYVEDRNKTLIKTTYVKYTQAESRIDTAEKVFVLGSNFNIKSQGMSIDLKKESMTFYRPKSFIHANYYQKSLESENFEHKGPLQIQAERFIILENELKSYWEGNVLLEQDNMKMTCHKLFVEYEKINDTRIIKRVVALENVKIVKANIVAVSKKAILTIDDKKLVLTESPKILRDSHLIWGETITLYLNQNDFHIKNPFGIFSSESQKDKTLVLTHIKAKEAVGSDAMDQIVWSGDVAATQNEMSLVCNKALIYFTKKNGRRVLKEIEAHDQVKIVKESIVTFSQKATFNDIAQKVLLTGNPIVWKGDDLIQGDRIFLNLKNNTVDIERPTGSYKTDREALSKSGEMKFAKDRFGTGKKPIQLKAETMIADDNKTTTYWKRNVIARQGDMTLFSDEAEVKYITLNRQRIIQEIKAKGNVKVIQKDSNATATHAVLNNKHRTIVLTGNPVVWKNQDVLVGDKITMYLDEDKIDVDQPKSKFLMKEELHRK